MEHEHPETTTPCSACTSIAERRSRLEARLEQPITSWHEFTQASHDLLELAGWALGLKCRLDDAAAPILCSGLPIAPTDLELIQSLAARLGLAEPAVVRRALLELAARLGRDANAVEQG